ncbi:hypothetical protein HC928_13025 [bacterium]|nr:hypothetical protein [bacterium]
MKMIVKAPAAKYHQKAVSPFTFSTVFRNRDNVIVPKQSDTDVQVLSYSRNIDGGNNTASLKVYGNIIDIFNYINYLKYDVTITENVSLFDVWHGYVQTVTVLNEQTSVVVSLSDVYNSVNVLYTDSSGSASETGFIEDADSITLWGRRQIVLSYNNLTEKAALAKAANYLAVSSQPVARQNILQSNKGSYCELELRGYSSLLETQYATRTSASVGTVGGTENVFALGYQGTSTNVLFQQGSLIDFTGNIALGAKDLVEIEGSVFNDGTYLIEDQKSFGSRSYIFPNVSFGKLSDYTPIDTSTTINATKQAYQFLDTGIIANTVAVTDLSGAPVGHNLCSETYIRINDAGVFENQKVQVAYSNTPRKGSVVKQFLALNTPIWNTAYDLENGIGAFDIEVRESGTGSGNEELVIVGVPTTYSISNFHKNSVKVKEKLSGTYLVEGCDYELNRTIGQLTFSAPHMQSTTVVIEYAVRSSNTLVAPTDYEIDYVSNQFRYKKIKL